jgi:hypothetical protein
LGKKRDTIQVRFHDLSFVPVAPKEREDRPASLVSQKTLRNPGREVHEEDDVVGVDGRRMVVGEDRRGRARTRARPLQALRLQRVVGVVEGEEEVHGDTCVLKMEDH